MNLEVKTVMKKALALLTLRSLSLHSPFKEFSWNRVRISLLNISRCDASYVGDFLQINFLYHQHVVWLHKNGRGLLFNPWVEGSTKYTLLMPPEIQKLVQDAWDTNRAPIPINPALN